MNIDVLKDKVFDVLVWILIIAFGLVTAYVTFEILNSQAEAEIQGYSFEGAFAGFIISSSVLASIYLQLRKSSNEVENLRAENRTLQRKLLRGTPVPWGSR